MIAILTSSLGGSYVADGKRVPTFLRKDNGLTDKIRQYIKDNAKVLIISAGPKDYTINDSVRYCQTEAFAMSGFSISSVEICDDRNLPLAEKLGEYDVIILAGGHVPTQNEFFKRIQLKEKLKDFTGLLIAWSAGTMNCAETVYAQPELEGEAISQEFQRFISGLGIIQHMIIPHFESVKTDTLDGFRLIEDITYPDSMGREFICLDDGSFLVCNNGIETLYGDAYLIKDGKQTQICRNEESIDLK